MNKTGPDHLLLKWGTIKGWGLKNSPEAFKALKEYGEIGRSMGGVMTQKDTDRQKELICIMIDKVNGEVQNDWTGEIYETAEEAKKYIMEYGKKEE